MSFPLDRAMANPTMARSIRRQNAREMAGRLPPSGLKPPIPCALSPLGSSSRAISFTVHSPGVSTNRNYHPKKGGGLYKDPALDAYQGAVAACASLALPAGWVPWTGPVAVTIRFFYATMRNDIDGAIKPTLDGMAVPKRGRPGAGVYRNDNKVMDLIVRKRKDAKRPRVEVEVEEVQ